jgi:hypothetical protein
MALSSSDGALQERTIGGLSPRFGIVSALTGPGRIRQISASSLHLARSMHLESPGRRLLDSKGRKFDSPLRR